MKKITDETRRNRLVESHNNYKSINKGKKLRYTMISLTYAPIMGFWYNWPLKLRQKNLRYLTRSKCTTQLISTTMCVMHLHICWKEWQSILWRAFMIKYWIKVLQKRYRIFQDFRLAALKSKKSFRFLLIYIQPIGSFKMRHIRYS